LRKYVFVPNNKRIEPFIGLQSSNSKLGLASFSGIEPLHPYAALAAATGTFPPDLALDASECWEMFSVMDSVARASERDEDIREIENLRPEIFFVNTECIKSADTIKYEAALRSVIERWLASPSCKNLMDSVTLALGGTIEKQVGQMEERFGNQSPYAPSEYKKNLSYRC